MTLYASFLYKYCIMENSKNQGQIAILDDEIRGKKRPWKPKKIRALKIADSFQRLGWEKKASRVRFCGSSLAFLVEVETGAKRLHDADFCRERLCPMCQWRKSMKIFHEVSRVMDVVQQEHKNLVPLFLTLTVRNCPTDQLSETLDTIFKGWYRLTNHRKMQRIVRGWFRALEVTYNEDLDTFHPHLHAVIMVDRAYFQKNNADYMETADWVQMWRTAAKLDYDPVCDVRRVKGKRKKAIAEVAKYTLKDTDFIKPAPDLTDTLVYFLSTGLKNRRLFAFGGILKNIAKQLGAESPDEGDLIHVDDDAIRGDVATMLEVYHWNFGIADYIRAGG